jgi:hypothetical protein
MAFFKTAKDIDKFQAGNAGASGYQTPRSHIAVCSMFSLEGNQGPMLTLEASAFGDNGLEKLAGKRTLDQIQLQPLHVCQQVIFIFITSAIGGRHEFFGSQRQSHALLQQDQQLPIDPVHLLANLLQFHFFTSPKKKPDGIKSIRGTLRVKNGVRQPAGRFECRKKSVHKKSGSLQQQKKSFYFS